MKQNQINKIIRALAICAIITAIIGATGCSKAKAVSQPPEPPIVEVVKVEQQDVPIYSEWIGTLDGMVNAQIKGQVGGYILSQNYTEGAFVKKGDLLFQIDARTFQAALDQAKSDLAKAEDQLEQAISQHLQAQAQVEQLQANLVKLQLDVKRGIPLIKAGVISQQDVDNAVQAERVGEAQVKASQAAVITAKAGISAAKSNVDAAKAAVRTAEVNLSFTRITAPIDGIAGIAQAQVGDLVSLINPTGPPLTTITKVDPIKVYFPFTEQEYLKNTRYDSAKNGDDAKRENLELEMILADGTTYPYKGKFFVADSKVDPKTGAIRMAGVFPNPGNILRPGQYARMRAVTSRKEAAMLIPQRAVTELQGRFQVAVVGADQKVDIRTVTVGDRVGSKWIIKDGLSAGDTVVAEGTQKVKPGIAVTTKPFVMPETPKQ